ncbi:hypothetical protein Cfor_01679 [Coptotermes formosanus]|uniref:Uncharacterized protein n=1 Tax=Coptotermes formosanus TaxID=36987 RepID=A0A6L2Q1A5_COPFO|nr:hypothetical protein Cfor_01679 [Coptotermes formosanus]
MSSTLHEVPNDMCVQLTVKSISCSSALMIQGIGLSGRQRGVITGASSGIGEQLAHALACAGVKLVLSARREHELKRVKQKCLEIGKNLTEGEILVLAMDVTAVQKHSERLQQVISYFGQVHFGQLLLTLAVADNS